MNNDYFVFLKVNQEEKNENHVNLIAYLLKKNHKKLRKKWLMKYFQILI
jgi:hypothetical protein